MAATLLCLLAASFVATAKPTVTAPLNPAYQQEEHAFYLSDLRAMAWS
jgi:hypothetical protein